MTKAVRSASLHYQIYLNKQKNCKRNRKVIKDDEEEKKVLKEQCENYDKYNIL